MASSWGTPTYRHRWGPYHRHTLVTAVATIDDDTAITVDLDTDEIPVGIFAGHLWGKVTGRVTTHNIAYQITSGASTVGAADETLIYNQTLSVTSDPDGLPPRSIFGAVTAPGNQNYLGHVTLPTNELRLYAKSAHATETTVTTLYLCLLSHRLEV